MASDFLDIIDQLDAAVFSGDSLEDEGYRKTFQRSIESWNVALERWGISAELSSEDKETVSGLVKKVVNHVLNDEEALKELSKKIEKIWKEKGKG